MLFALRVWWDAIKLTIVLSWDEHQVKKKIKENRDDTLTKMLDMV